jgi:hypothetical protein
MWNLCLPLLCKWTFGFIFETLVCITSCKCIISDSWMKLHFFINTWECLFRCVCAKHFMLTRNSENPDTGKQAWKLHKSFRLKRPRKIECTAFQSIRVAIFLRRHRLNGECVFKDRWTYSMATKVNEVHLKILSQGISHIYSMDTWKGNIYSSILIKQMTGRKVTQVNISHLFPK